MEWGKAKNILIILFLILNVFLFVNVLSRFTNRQAERASRAAVEEIIAKRGVTVECELPFESVYTKHLIFKDNKDNVSEIANNLAAAAGAEIVYTGPESLIYTNNSPAESFYTGGNSELNNAVSGILRQKGIDISEFVLDEIITGVDGGKTLNYIHKYQGSLIFDSFIIVSVSGDGGIRGIHLNYRGVQGFSEVARLKMVPGYQIILKNYLENGLVIKAIDIGYLGQPSTDYGESGEYGEQPSFIESVEGAVWRVKLSDGSERFFEGAYGEEIL